MANFHFGKISEVWKHGVLAEVLDEDQPRRFAETHAGSAKYSLTPSPERDYGVYRFKGLSAATSAAGTRWPSFDTYDRICELFGWAQAFASTNPPGGQPIDGIGGGTPLNLGAARRRT